MAKYNKLDGYAYAIAESLLESPDELADAFLAVMKDDLDVRTTTTMSSSLTHNDTRTITITNGGLSISVPVISQGAAIYYHEGNL